MKYLIPSCVYLQVIILTVLQLGSINNVNSFSISSQYATKSPTVMLKTTTIERPREETIIPESDVDIAGEVAYYENKNLEYYEDSRVSRESEDPFHIILLNETFTNDERVTVAYVSGCLTYVIAMPNEESLELTNMCLVNGMSCLGTWRRDECLDYGRQLLMRDLAVRVVPYCKGK